MNRRNFFGGIASFMAGSAVAHAAPSNPNATEHGGWTIRWRGWEQAPFQTVQYGVWLARKADHPKIFLYSVANGVCLWGFDGAHLNMAYRDREKFVDDRTPQAVKDGLQAEALKAMKTYIDTLDEAQLRY